MGCEVFLIRCFLYLTFVITYVCSEIIHQDFREKRIAAGHHIKHGPHTQIEELTEEMTSKYLGRDDYERQQNYKELKERKGPPSQKGPPDHRGPPDGKGPLGHKGPPSNKGPPPNRGPPDHRPLPPHKDLTGDKEIREPIPNNDFISNPTPPYYNYNNQYTGGPIVNAPPNVNVIKPQKDKNICNQVYVGNIPIYEYQGKPVFQAVAVTPES